jgi:hypothetical protein
MSDDLVQDLNQLQRYAAGLGDLAAAAEPRRIECTDASGAVRVTLGPDGLPASISVDEDWKRYLRADRFAGAVRQATDAAALHRTLALAQALPNWPAVAAPAVPEGEIEPVPAAPAHRRDLSGVRPRDPGNVIAEALTILDSGGRPAEAPPPRGVGSAAFGKLTIALTIGGLESCTADPQWVAQKTGEELTDAFAAALTTARADLANAVASSPAGRLNGLLDELLASRQEE